MHLLWKTPYDFMANALDKGKTKTEGTQLLLTSILHVGLFYHLSCYRERARTTLINRVMSHKNNSRRLM